MPEFSFYDVKTNPKKYLQNFVVLVSTIIHLLTHSLLFMLGISMFFPQMGGEPELMQSSAWPYIGALIVAGTLCALNIARIQRPWRNDTGLNLVRIIAGTWSLLTLLLLLAVGNLLLAPILAVSFIYVLFSHRLRKEKA